MSQYQLINLVKLSLLSDFFSTLWFYLYQCKQLLNSYLGVVFLSILQRASERLRHAFNRVERSESRSESEADKYSVRRKHRKPKKKSKRKKKSDSEMVGTQILESHQHHIRCVYMYGSVDLICPCSLRLLHLRSCPSHIES